MKRLAYIIAAAALVFACAPEEFNHPSENQAPQTASAYQPLVTVDQETNQATFELGQKGIVPVWVFQDKEGDWTEYHTGDGFKKIFVNSGDYSVRMFVMNAAGTSPDYVMKTFHVDNTLVNFDRYIRYISGGSERVWRIDASEPAHQACGPAVDNPVEWWSAKPDEKKDWGLYDNRLTFSSEDEYTFDPGEAGTVYVNAGVTASPYVASKTDDGQDYRHAVSTATYEYKFEVVGDDLFLTLPEGALFPYIPNDDFLTDTRFHLISLDNNSMTLVWYTATGNNGGPIAWQFILTSKAAATVFNGFNYNADSNLWKPADEAHTYSQYYATGSDWQGLENPAITNNGNAYSFTLATETQNQWQAQFFIIPDEPVVLTADKNYDFSVVMNLSQAVPGVTFKLTDVGDDGNFLFTERRDIPANEDYVFYLTDLAGIDAPNGVKMVFDFGGCPANTEVNISRIVLKDHAIDDGTVLPSEEEKPEEPEETYTYGSDVLTGLYLKETWFSAAGWGGGLDPQASFEGGKLTLTVPEVGGEEWMGQVKLVADVPASADKQYAFFAKIESSSDGVATVKVADANDDSNHAFFYDNNVALSGSQVVAYKNEPVSPDQDYAAIMVIFDFGRMAPGTEITVTGIELKEITGTSGGGGLTEGENLWANAEVNMTYWYSDAANWDGTSAPAETEILPGNGLRVVMPTGFGGAEWKGQNAFHAPGINASKDELYDFWLTLEADADVTLTVKLAWEGHDGTNAFFYDPNVSLKASEPLKYVKASIKTDPEAEERNDYDGIVLFVDTGRCPDGTEVIIKDIHFQKHIGGGDVPPEPEEPDYTTNDPSIDPSIFKIDAASNLWRSADITFAYWYSASDWSGSLAPITFKADDWSGLKIIVPEGIGGNEWQGQSIWHTDIPASKDALYDFCFTAKTDEDIPALTVKLAWEGNDGEHAFFYVNNASVKAGIPYQFRMSGIAPDVDYDKVVLFIDLGRAQAGTAVSFTDFCFQEQGGGASYGEDLLGGLFLKETWFSATGWGGGLDPQASFEGGKLTLTVPAVGGEEWMGQVKLVANVAVSAAKQYDFSCKVKADDSATITVKLADANDDSNHAFFYDNNVVLAADETKAYKQSPTSPDNDYEAVMLVFDFGRCNPGTEIVVTDIVLREIL